MTMQQQVSVNLLKCAAGQQMFCASCGKIMDFRTTVMVDVADREKKPLATSTMCAKCYDSKRAKLESHCRDLGYTLDVVDGRELGLAQEATNA